MNHLNQNKINLYYKIKNLKLLKINFKYNIQIFLIIYFLYIYYLALNFY